MTEIDAQLVQRIADQVMAAMRARGGLPGAAQVRPPAGVCTGDYSKFQELSPPAVERSAKPQAAALAGIITAEQLRDAIKASPDGVAHLAADARLTPLAADYARDHAGAVQRTESRILNQKSRISTPWLWWADGHCPAVAALTTRRRDRLTPITAERSAAGLLRVVRDLAAAVRGGRVSGGVLFVGNAALAMCYVNRCRSLRGVVGTCDEAVEQGVRDLGANVLVIEYPHVAGRAMEAMIERITAQPPRLPAHVQRELSDLQECG